MIIGIGTDIVNCKRIQHSYEKFGESFLAHILTQKEKEQMPTRKESSFQWIAARFAVKEAAVKALGTGFSGGISLLHIEVLRDVSKAPYLTFLGKGLEKAEELGVKNSHVSYSHEKEFAVAYVVLEN